MLTRGFNHFALLWVKPTQTHTHTQTQAREYKIQFNIINKNFKLQKKLNNKQFLNKLFMSIYDCGQATHSKVYIGISESLDPQV